MVVCADEEVARTVRLLRNQGMEQRYHNELAGLNNRMTDLAAAIGRVQLRALDGRNARRQQIAAALPPRVCGPSGCPDQRREHPRLPPVHRPGRRPRPPPEGAAGAGVESGVFYPVPTHRLPAYDLDLALPETERAAGEVLSLPVHPGLTDDESTSSCARSTP